MGKGEFSFKNLILPAGVEVGVGVGRKGAWITNEEKKYPPSPYPTPSFLLIIDQV